MYHPKDKDVLSSQAALFSSSARYAFSATRYVDNPCSVRICAVTFLLSSAHR